MRNSYDEKDPIRLIGTFVNISGVMTDPSAVYLYLVPPAQGKVVPGTIEYTYAQGSLTRAAAGSFYRDLNPLGPGTWGVWTYSYVGTGNLNAAFAGQFFVRQPPRG